MYNYHCYSATCGVTESCNKLLKADLALCN